jgi:Tol biopolymer transport system component
MTLAAGSRLGPYEILATLGAGGMGEVYRARDPRLGREVAIKVLPEAVAQDHDRLLRFEQEARSASALNHPNIVTIYEIGTADSASYIAMELIEGRTLREVLADGPVPTKRLLAIAAQIADALARAHEAGIVHRDLKPENLMVTREGLVKVLDFGLAKLALPESGEISAMPTLAKPETHPGIVLGTVGYMSPEQASGRPLDFRSDQFSLGSILYEMATGRRAFSRSTTAEALVAIMREEPEPIATLSPGLPAPVRWVIERCLAKDPGERYVSTRDLARDLMHLRDHVSGFSVEAAPVILARRLGWLGPALIAGLLVAAALAVFAVLRGRDRRTAQPVVRFAVSIPPGATYSPGEVSRGFALSPDGTRLVIEARVRGRRRLFLRPLDADRATELEGTSGAEAPFWSPDSRFVAFFADGKLKKIPVSGGPSEELCAAGFPIVGSWGAEGTILFSQLADRGIYGVSARGGEAFRVTALEPLQVGADLWPQFLPDGKRFLYLASRGGGSTPGRVRIASLSSKESRVVTRLDSRFEYAAPGYLLFVRDATMFAQRFDEANARTVGEPILLADNVHYFIGPSHAAFSVSQTGVLAFQTAAPLSRLVWLDRAGKETGTLGQPAALNGLRISPDGGKAAVAIEDRRTGTCDVWVFDLPRGVSTRLHSGPIDENHPVWSSDASRVLYRSDRKGPPDIYEITLGAPGSEREVLAEPGVQQPEDSSRDGRFLAYCNNFQAAASEIWLLPLSGDRKPVRWLQTHSAERSPRFSPDGRWIAYESDESGDPEIYVALTDGGGEKQRLSPAGGRLPRWRRDGRELCYVTPDGSLVSIPIAPGTRFQASAPVQLFHVEAGIESYDVAPDGSRFLVSTPAEKGRESPIRVIVNWPATLKGEK